MFNGTIPRFEVETRRALTLSETTVILFMRSTKIINGFVLTLMYLLVCII